MGSIHSVETITINEDDQNHLVPLKKRRSVQQANVQSDENIQSAKILSASKQGVLFDHSVELFGEEWERGNIKIVTESIQPMMARLSLQIKDQTHFDELLTVESKFTPVKKTLMKWLGEVVSQGEMKTTESTIRFKTAKIRDKFFDVWQGLRKQMNLQHTESGKS